MSGQIELRNLSVRYPPGDPVLQIERLVMNQGEIAVVAGASGSGKSTLGHAIAGLLPLLGAHASGTLQIGGRNLYFDSIENWTDVRGTLIRWIPQEPSSAFTTTRPLLPQMLEGTERSDGIYRKLEGLLERADLPPSEQLATIYPFEMSGGMLQRAALVSALLPDPLVVVADEPTAHLDPPRSLEIARTVSRLAGEVSVAFLWITHDLRMASALADRIFFLSEGQIEAEGDPELLLDPGREDSPAIVTASARLALPQ
jgi:peptide/nickel transport system ATP-binding protein